VTSSRKLFTNRQIASGAPDRRRLPAGPVRLETRVGMGSAYRSSLTPSCPPRSKLWHGG